VAKRARHLRFDILLTGAAITLLAVTILATLIGRAARRVLERQADERGVEVATRAGALATAYAQEHQRALILLAETPMIRSAADEAGQRARQMGLDALDIPTLEQRFRRQRALGGDPALRRYLQRFSERMGFEELMFTDDHGYIVLATGLTSDFVQSDEEWWRDAIAQGLFEGEAEYDSSAQALAIEIAVAIPGGGAGRPAGVVKGLLGLDRLALLMSGHDLGDEAFLQLVDARGRLLATPHDEDMLRQVDVDTTIMVPDSTVSRKVTTARGEELAVSIPANRNRWWVLFRQPTEQAYALAGKAQRAGWLGGLVLLAVVLAVLYRLGSWLTQRVTDPVRAAGEVARQVAAGDLAVVLTSHQSEAAEVTDLLSSIQAMVMALRRLVGAVRTASDEAAAMAAEISASTAEVSASTEQLAATSHDLTTRFGEQATVVRAAADDAGRILQIGTTLADGSQESVRRNADLSALARAHKQVLDESRAQLAELVQEVQRGAAEAETLALASTEIHKFITQAKRVASQTNMLALNAAIEAARAGPHGRGFAVVADEVRKLATQAAVAGTETTETIRAVLSQVQNTRDRLARLAERGASAQQAAEVAGHGLGTVMQQAEANELWSHDIAKAAAEVRRLIEEIANRLRTLAAGTDNLLASAEQIAASSAQQSGATEEIASSADQLAHAADRLTATIGSFRLTARDSETQPPPSSANDDDASHERMRGAVILPPAGPIEA
jgi:methyl-accepting chemotaxis protein